MHYLKKKIFSTIILLSGCFSSFAQSPVEFEKTTHDFGTISEKEGVVSYTFHFENTSKKSITITHVEPSCGCTLSEWTKESIAPRKKGFVKAEFNPFNRPGIIEKTLTVTFNTTPTSYVILTLKGIVQPAPSSIEALFPEKIGALRLKTTEIALNHIFTHEPTSKRFDLFNESKDPIKFTQLKLPAYIQLVFPSSSLIIPPNQKYSIKLLYDAKKRNDYGWVRDSITLLTNDTATKKIVLATSAFIEDLPESVTKKQLSSIPRASFLYTEYTASLPHDSILNISFPIKNKGKKTLHFKNVKTSCTCLKTSLKKSMLGIGQETTLQVTYHYHPLHSSKTPYSIAVFSNDPIHPTQILTLKFKK